MRSGAKPTVLLCDAAFSAVPMLIALRYKGYRVAVCGSRPADPGHALADASFVLDYGDRDALLRKVKDERIEFLVPGCTDVSYLSCAWVADQLGLPGYGTLESAEIIHRKDRFREFCRTHQFPTPQSVLSATEVSRLKFPILVKPSDSFSGKGIVKVSCMEELSRGIELARSQSGTRSVVFEEFVDGNLYSHSAFLRDGGIATDFFVNEYCTVHPYQVNSSHLCVDLDPSVILGLRQWLEAFASALRLADGLVHTQFISDGSGFYPIEVMRRCPGDLYAMLIEKSTGADYAGMYASAFCESGVAVEREAPQRRFFSRHTVSVDRDCTFFASGIVGLGAKSSFVPLKKTGELLRAAPLDRAGIYFIEHATTNDMKAVTPALKNHVTLETFGHV